MANRTYSELLKSPKWQRKRLEIMQRDNWSCVTCGNDKETLHVHHKKYIKGRKPWEYENSQLCTLCYICHENEHFPSKETIPAKSVKNIIITTKDLLAIDYDSNHVNSCGENFVPAIIRWTYTHLAEIKNMTNAAFKQSLFTSRVSQKEYVEYLGESLHKECLKYRVQIKNKGGIIYG